MAVIHDTTMSPGKLDLLSSWLPVQPWYAGQGRTPELARAGGFRLDDPDGEVGIEFMIVTDGSGDQLPGADDLPRQRAAPRRRCADRDGPARGAWPRSAAP